MSLEDKYKELLYKDDGLDNSSLAEQCVQICDEFAVGFAEWCSYNSWALKELDLWENTNYLNLGRKTTTELLEIYKQGL